MSVHRYRLSHVVTLATVITICPTCCNPEPWSKLRMTSIIWQTILLLTGAPKTRHCFVLLHSPPVLRINLFRLYLATLFVKVSVYWYASLNKVLSLPTTFDLIVSMRILIAMVIIDLSLAIMIVVTIVD